MEITLGDFDRDYFETLDGRESISVPANSVYYTILCNGEKAGVVGYIPVKFPPGEGFMQVVVAPEFRGRGIAGVADDMVARKHELKVVYASIKADNTASIRAHEKAGFSMLRDDELAHWRQMGFLGEDEVRLRKRYNEN